MINMSDITLIIAGILRGVLQLPLIVDRQICSLSCKGCIGRSVQGSIECQFLCLGVLMPSWLILQRDHTEIILQKPQVELDYFIRLHKSLKWQFYTPV